MKPQTVFKLARVTFWTAVFVRDTRNLKNFFRLGGILNDERALAEAARLWRQDPLLAERLNARFDMGEVDMATLTALPAGTLGREYANFMQEHGLSTSSMPNVKAMDDARYVLMNIHQTHDIHHVLLGLKPNAGGETALQAFYVAQLSLPFSSFIVGLSFAISALFSVRGMDRGATYVFEGWWIGKRAQNLVGVDWHSYWHAPLAEVRAELGIVPYSGHPTGAVSDPLGAQSL